MRPSTFRPRPPPTSLEVGQRPQLWPAVLKPKIDTINIPVYDWDSSGPTYKFAGGDVYVGGWCDGKQFGTGTMTLADGRSYTGEWEEGSLDKDSKVWITAAAAPDKVAEEGVDLKRMLKKANADTGALKSAMSANMSAMSAKVGAGGQLAAKDKEVDKLKDEVHAKEVKELSAAVR